ncbi:exodeoxyribonuclease VII large subunit [Arenicella chitinivorans]|nr:exodeoxyribonuclease VII large subunit [Arenicella chitinivorans]
MNQNPTIFKVSELADEMRRLMEASYPEIWIEGELSSLSSPASGHLYFSLKDERSQLRCAMFKGRASVNRYRPKVGDLVRVRAKISVYTARGDLQCIVQYIEEAGEGILQRRYEELKQKLNAEGLFSQAHKQAVPKFAQCIGLVTSSSGAAVRDILTTLQRRCPGIPVIIYPSLVQGDTAAASIVAAINAAVAHQHCDVLIVSRGGGSLEDLWSFNDEQVARAIYNCPIPVVSGVGHEVDVTIADLVADLRAPTPTAAAELLSPDTTQLQTQLNALGQRLPLSIKRQFQRRAQNVDMTGRQLVHPRQQLSNKFERLGKLSAALVSGQQRQRQYRRDRLNAQGQRLTRNNPIKQIRQHQAQQNDVTKRLRGAEQRLLNHAQERLRAMGNQLHLVSPLATLDRGFAIAHTENNAVLKHGAQTSVGATIRVRVSDAQLGCTVDEITPND